MDGTGDTEVARTPAATPTDGTAALETITTRECLDLLRESAVGRLGVTDRALPMILPVNFRIFNDWVVVRTHPGSTMAAAARDTVVAFEVDRVDVEGRSGWSVVVVGHAGLLTGGDSFRALTKLGLPTWAPDGEDCYLVIKMERVSGRRLTFATDSGNGNPELTQ